MVYAQDQQKNYTQLWAEFGLHKTFGNGLIYVGELGPRTLLGEKSNWAQFELSQNVRYNLIGRADALGGLLLNYTIQSDTTDLYNSFELRPWIGARFNFNPNSKLAVSLLSRWEQRFLYYSNLDDVQKSGRIRNRLEFTYAINHPNNYQDNLWYLTFDGEWYIPTNQKISERFADNVRLRLGIGYRHTYAWRYVVMLMEQFSRNTIDEEFRSSNFIIDLRILHFLGAGKTKE